MLKARCVACGDQMEMTGRRVDTTTRVGSRATTRVGSRAEPLAVRIHATAMTASPGRQHRRVH